MAIDARTHRQDPQQRCLAGVLQADHGDVQLLGPASRRRASSASTRINTSRQSDHRSPPTAHARTGTHDARRRSKRKASIPEQAQQPIIDALEQARHDGQQGRTGWRIDCSGPANLRRRRLLEREPESGSAEAHPSSEEVRQAARQVSGRRAFFPSEWSRVSGGGASGRSGAARLFPRDDRTSIWQSVGLGTVDVDGEM